MSTTTLDVPTISCGHCKSSIEGAVAGLPGINRVDVGIEDKKVEIDFDEGTVDLATIVETIEEQGYDVVR